MNVVTARCSSAAADSGSVTLTLSGAADQQMADYVSIRTVHKADRTSPGSSFDPPSFAQVSFARDTMLRARFQPVAFVRVGAFAMAAAGWREGSGLPPKPWGLLHLRRR